MTLFRARPSSAPAVLALILFVAIALQATPSLPARSNRTAAPLPGGPESEEPYRTLILASDAAIVPALDFHAMSAGDLSAALASPARRLSAFSPDGAVDPRRRVLRSLPFGAILADAGERNHVDSLLLAALVEAESQFSPAAVSPCGAVGLMQLLPATALEYGARNLRDPYVNVDAGSRYLRSLLDRFKRRPVLAIAAYNTGPEVVARYGCVPPFRETQEFVRRVLSGYAQKWRSLGPQAGGVEPGLLTPPDRMANLAATR